MDRLDIKLAFPHYAKITAFILACVMIVLMFSRYDLAKTTHPKKYEESVILYSKQFDLDPNLVYAIIKIESNYKPEARSRADARGLMQITPETFNWIKQKRFPSTCEVDSSLYDPDTNIKYGCAILHEFITEFGDIKTALAAYNAGRSNAKVWLTDKRYSKDGVTIHNTPFKETNSYVQNVYTTFKSYKKAYEREAN